MGGKTKQSQRTKNNARPSSSGRSAELLSGVKLDAGVVSVAGTQLPALFPSLAAPSIDPLISPELQLCLKKLNKKDPITKTKALQELTELVAKSSVDDVVAALPCWSHFYKILTWDPDRKVRECTQACHGAVVSACGRRVAPQLKQLLPAWLQAQHDEHAPAHTHARNSLAKTFPDSKLAEALSFCKEPVVAHLLDVLLGRGEPAHLRPESAEERALQRGRAECCALLGLQHCARRLPPAHGAWLRGQLQRLLQDDAFWKRATHTDARTRAAWFGALGSIITRFKDSFATEYGVKTLHVLVGSRESNPLAAAQLWECLLLFMHNVPDWYQYLEQKELLSEKILDLLENGGWGDARNLSNMLLPILASLPEQILTKEFYAAFFDNMLSGLEKKSILNSKSERQHWVVSLEECLRYLSAQAQPFAADVVTRAHRAWLRRALGAARPLLRPSAAAMASLLRHWLARAPPARPDPLVRNFWQNVGATLAHQTDELPPDRAAVAERLEAHVLLLRTLRTSLAQEPRTRPSIKFELDSSAAEPAEPAARAPPLEPAARERCERDLDETVRRACAHYFEFARARELCECVVSPALPLLAEFDSEQLFADIAQRLGCAGGAALYSDVLRGWLAGDSMRCAALLDVVFMLLRHLAPDEQDAVFDSFKQFPPSVVEWCLARSLSHPHASLAAVRRWLRSALVADAVRGLCARLVRSGDGRARSLLLMCLNCDADGESIVSPAAVEAALQQLSASLSDVGAVGAVGDAGGAALEARGATAARLAATLPPHPALLRALLSLTVTLPRGDPRLSLDTWCEVRDAWQDGVTSLHAHERAAFLSDAAAMLHTRAGLDSNTADNPPEPDSSTESNDSSGVSAFESKLRELEHVVSLCPRLALAGHAPAGRGPEGCELAGRAPAGCELAGPAPSVRDAAAFSRLLLRAPHTDRHAEACATRHLILTGHLNCPFEDNPIVASITNDTLPELSKDDFILFAKRVVFRSLYLRSLCAWRAHDACAQDACAHDACAQSWGRALLADDYFQGEFVHCIHHYNVICTLYEGYAFWPHYKLIEQTKNRLTTLLDDIIKETAPDIRRSIADRLSELASSKGYFWAYSRKYFEDQIKLYDPSSNVIPSEKGSPIVIDNSQSDIDNSHIDKDNRQGDKDNSQSNKDNSQFDTDNSQSDKDNSQSDKDISQSVVDSSPSDKDGQSELQSKIESESIESKEEKETDESNPLIKNLKDIITGPALLHTLHNLQANAKTSPDESELLRTSYYIMVANMYAAHAHSPDVVRTLLRDAPALAACSPDVIVNTYYQHNHVMLYEKEISPAPWAQVVCNARACGLLARAVRWHSSAPHWDFANISLCSLLTSLQLSKAHWGTAKVAVLCVSVVGLLRALEPQVADVARRAERERPAAHVAALPAEWRDIYAPDAHHSLLELMLHVLESSSKTIDSNQAAVVQALLSATPHMRWECLAAGHRTGAYNLRRLVGACTAVLREPVHSAFKYLAYGLMRLLLKPLVLEDAEKLAAWSSEPRGAGADADADAAPLRLSLHYYDDALLHLQDVVETALSHVRVCEEVCSMVPFSDAHSLALGWLLLADLLNQQCALARDDLAHHYIQIYREQVYAESVLTTALRLLPRGVLAQAAPGPPAAAAPLAAHGHLFTDLPVLDVYAWCSDSALSAVACRCVSACVRGAGAARARGWRGAAHPRAVHVLDNITSRYITPHVVREEFALLQRKSSDMEDTEVTINRSALEVRCVLAVDEKAVELVVSLARQHPLVLPRLAAEHAAAGNVAWILMYLGYQNGTILNALKMWTASVNNKMEKAPQCYICYCRLHHATGRLPGVHCHTCRNKFHNVCLRKWFLTSGKMTCPLCRANF